MSAILTDNDPAWKNIYELIHTGQFSTALIELWKMKDTGNLIATPSDKKNFMSSFKYRAIGDFHFPFLASGCCLRTNQSSDRVDTLSRIKKLESDKDRMACVLAHIQNGDEQKNCRCTEQIKNE